MGDFHQWLIMHLKLNLSGLPDCSVTDETLEVIAQPFLQELKAVHTTRIRKVWRDVILPCLATLLMLVLAAAVRWTVRKRKYLAVCRFIERTARTPKDKGAALQLADFSKLSTNNKDDASQPLPKTPGKAAAKVTAKRRENLKPSAPSLRHIVKTKKYNIFKKRNYLSKRYETHL